MATSSSVHFGRSRSFSRRSIRCLILVAVAIGFSGAACETTVPPPDPCAQAKVKNEAMKQQILADDHVLGSPSAPVVVFEHSDLQCPFCRSFHLNTFPTIKANYIDTNKVRWVFRHYPLRNAHLNAQVAAEASECASDQGKFFEFVNAVFNNQSILADGNGVAVPADTAKANLKAIAAQVGCTSATFDPCLDGGSKAARVQRDVDAANNAGFGSQAGAGTPGFEIPNQAGFVFGNRSIANMSAMLDTAIGCMGN